ncbi:hypothetical protein GLT81_00395 [Nanohaloarchaea archaeon]|nr:hypothetical protein [Candidatus Nanohaloarchaea archaeon]
MVLSANIHFIPKDKEIGNLQRGEKIDSSFLVNISFREYEDPSEINDVRISPSITMPTIYRDEEHLETDKASDEDVSKWIDIKNETVINAQTSETYYSGTGEDINAEGKLDYTLEVPEQAEPGAHYFSLRAGTESTGGGGIDRYRYETIKFTIPGDVERSIEIENISTTKTSKNEVILTFELANTGTVTVVTKKSEFGIFNEDSEKVSKLSIPSTKISRDQVKRLNISWRSLDQIKNAQYKLEGSLDLLSSTKAFERNIDVEKVKSSQDLDSKSSNTEKSNNNISGEFFREDVNQTTLILLIAILATSFFIVNSYRE